MPAEHTPAPPPGQAAASVGDLLTCAGDPSAFAPTASPDVAPPGYAVETELGRGGMGVVYLATQAGLNRRVALKMILSGAHATAKEQARFLAEAEAVAALRHPHVVQIHEVGTHAGRPFFTLEFCDGGSLADKLAAGPLPPREAAELVAKLADGVAAAHAAGIVHRDLKPANVLLAGGVPKLTDFGLAKRDGGSELTATGAVLGTPSYMAPEQARGEAVGPAADLYALGAVLYECLTGRPPFRAATAVDTLRQVLDTEPVGPRAVNPAVDRDLDTITLKCLEKAPAKRYPTAALAEDLRAWLDNRPVSARPTLEHDRVVKWGQRRPGLAAAVYVLVIVAGLFGTTVGLAPTAAGDLFHEAWVRNKMGRLVALMAGGLLALFAVTQAAMSVRQRVGWRFGLLRVAWVLPACVLPLLTVPLIDLTVRTGLALGGAAVPVGLAVFPTVLIVGVWLAYRRSAAVRAHLDSVPGGSKSLFWVALFIVCGLLGLVAGLYVGASR